MNQNPMTRKDYNGWTNYETWVVKLWLDNHEESYDYWNERAEDIFQHVDEDDRCRQLAFELEDSHSESLPELQGFASDLMRAAMNEVNWDEIAQSLLEDAKETCTI